MVYKCLQTRRDTQKAHRKRNHTSLMAYLAEHPCVDCGEDDPIVLEFDHRDGEEKKFDVCRMATGMHFSWKRILAEIMKCDVRCANCHRRRTYKQRGYGCKN